HVLAERTKWQPVAVSPDAVPHPLVAEHHQIRRGPMEEAKGHPREAGMRERALALDDHPVHALRRFADHELRGSGDEVGDDGVDGDAAAGYSDPGLACRDELRAFARAPQRRHDLERRGHLPHRGIRADREHDPGALAARAIAANRKIRGWLAQLAHLRATALRRGGELRIGEHALVQPVPYL